MDKGELIKKAKALALKAEAHGVDALKGNDKELLRCVQDALGHKMNDSTVFCCCDRHQVVKEKDLDVWLDYISTPYGYLFSTNLMARNQGFGGLPNLRDVIQDNFIAELHTPSEELISKLIKRFSDGHSNGRDEMYVPILKKAYGQAVQLSLF